MNLVSRIAGAWNLMFLSNFQLGALHLKRLTQEPVTLLINTSLQRGAQTHTRSNNCFNSFSYKSSHSRPALTPFPHVTHVTHVTYLTYLTVLALSLLLPNSASAAFGVTSI